MCAADRPLALPSPTTNTQLAGKHWRVKGETTYMRTMPGSRAPFLFHVSSLPPANPVRFDRVCSHISITHCYWPAGSNLRVEFASICRTGLYLAQRLFHSDVQRRPEHRRSKMCKYNMIEFSSELTREQLRVASVFLFPFSSCSSLFRCQW